MVSYVMGCASFLLFFRFVGWVERSETHRPGVAVTVMLFGLLHRHSGMVRRTRPGISRFRVRRCAMPRNDGDNYFFGGEGHGRCGPRRPSNAFAMPSTPRSSKRRPTICTPIGKPLAS